MHRPRQLISENGTPVGIHNNQEREDYTSLTIGNQDLPLNEHIAQNADPAVLEAWGMAEREVDKRIGARIMSQLGDPNDSSTFDYHLLREEVLNADPGLAERLATTTATRKTERGKRYHFGEQETEAQELIVGTEAALIVRKESPGHMIELLQQALLKYERFGLGGSTEAGKIRTLIEKLRIGGSIGYIPQVEVLSEFRGKGHARSLIQVALWEIFQTRNLSFATAIVEDHNPHGEYMRRAFEREGFSSIHCPEVRGRSGQPAYHLMFKEKNTSR